MGKYTAELDALAKEVIDIKQADVYTAMDLVGNWEFFEEVLMSDVYAGIMERTGYTLEPSTQNGAGEVWVYDVDDRTVCTYDYVDEFMIICNTIEVEQNKSMDYDALVEHIVSTLCEVIATERDREV